MNAQPYAKVTIIIEAGDEVVTHTIHKARNLVMETNALEINEGLTLPKEFLSNSIGFNIGMIADFDPEAGNILTTAWTPNPRAEGPGKPPSFEPDDSAVREMHMIGIHPGYDYKTTEGQRKNWNDWDTPPEGEGWERNLDRGILGWERFDYTEKSYWRRKRS